jgi:hypothetical protein
MHTLKYLFEMKVADADLIADASFKNRLDGAAWPCDKNIKRRLRLLCNEKLILAQRMPFSPEHYYTLASKGMKLLQAAGFLANPKIRKLRPSELSHDLIVAKLRNQMMESGIATEWVSEVLIRERFNFFKSVRLIPDALYRNAEGQWVALEFERARKDKRRYDEKLQNLVRLIRSRYKEEITFHKVHVVCEFEYVQKQIEDIAYIYQPLVHVELRSKLEGNQRKNYEK